MSRDDFKYSWLPPEKRAHIKAKEWLFALFAAFVVTSVTIVLGSIFVGIIYLVVRISFP